MTLAPLYLHEDGGNGELPLDGRPRTNFTPAFLDAFQDALGQTNEADASPEDIFHFAYGVFHSPTYRRRYAEHLRSDFPRLPLASSPDLFRALARLGNELVALHLVEAPAQKAVSARYDKATKAWRYEVAKGQTLPVMLSFDGPAKPEISAVGWSGDTVWIDTVKAKKGATEATVTGTVGFHGVPEEVWKFQIGGYQVCEKWLKDRGPKKGHAGRILSAADIASYQKIVVALFETIRLMGEIDEVIEEHGGWPQAFASSGAAAIAAS